MKSVSIYISEQIKYMPLIIRMSKYTTKDNYKNYMLGRVWQYVTPVITAIFYYIVFGYIYKRSLGDIDIPYLPWMLIGMATWGLTNGSIIGSLHSIIYQLNLSNTFGFPNSISPTTIFVSRIVEFLVISACAVVVAIRRGYYPSIYWVQLLYYLFAITVFTISLSLLNATVTLLFRDYSQIVRTIARVGMYVSGVMINLQSDSIPAFVRRIVMLNPFYYLIEGIRDAIFSREWFFDKISFGIFFWALTVFILVVGTYLFYKYQESFRDFL
jgi:teichoic acid transport system permease protein